MSTYDAVPTRRFEDGFDRRVPLVHADALTVYLTDDRGQTAPIHQIKVMPGTDFAMARQNALAYIKWHQKITKQQKAQNGTNDRHQGLAHQPRVPARG